jgi:hypothetical protein
MVYNMPENTQIWPSYGQDAKTTPSFGRKSTYLAITWSKLNIFKQVIHPQIVLKSLYSMSIRIHF